MVPGETTSSDVSVSPAEFRAACGLFPTGVTIVTRQRPDGGPHGMTVSSFTSVSLDPPLILICIDRTASFLKDLTPDVPFAINVLSESQQAHSVLFATRKDEDRFTSVEWEPGWRGVPLLRGTLVSFSCSIRQIVEGGDHLVLIANVEEIRRRDGNPLVWCDRNYHCLPRQMNDLSGDSEK